MVSKLLQKLLSLTGWADHHGYTHEGSHIAGPLKEFLIDFEIEERMLSNEEIITAVCLPGRSHVAKHVSPTFCSVCSADSG